MSDVDAAIGVDAETATDAAAGVPDAGFDPGATNPARLWLSPRNGSEVNLYLGRSEPPPF